MTDTLRERVARAMAETRWGDPDLRGLLRDEADAAIALVLEEAAKVCEITFDSEMASYGDYFAAAIRALKEDSNANKA